MTVLFQHRSFVFKNTIFSTRVLIAIMTQQNSHVSFKQTLACEKRATPQHALTKHQSFIKKTLLIHCDASDQYLVKRGVANEAPTRTNLRFLPREMQRCPMEMH